MLETVYYKSAIYCPSSSCEDGEALKAKGRVFKIFNSSGLVQHVYNADQLAQTEKKRKLKKKKNNETLTWKIGNQPKGNQQDYNSAPDSHYNLLMPGKTPTPVYIDSSSPYSRKQQLHNQLTFITDLSVAQ